MLQLTGRHAATVFLPFVLVTAGLIAAGPGVRADQYPGMNHLPVDAARMYALVKTPHPGELKWQQIPWLTDLQEAIRQARAERRPLLLFVSGDDPLEKC
jgi:hypothetical protein